MRPESFGFRGARVLGAAPLPWILTLMGDATQCERSITDTHFLATVESTTAVTAPQRKPLRVGPFFRMIEPIAAPPAAGRRLVGPSFRRRPVREMRPVSTLYRSDLRAARAW